MVMGDIASGTDVLIIGGGPGGYVAAIRAAQLGKDVTLVERKGEAGLGGICLNEGCIPSKALIYASELAYELGHSEELGIVVKDVSIDLPKMQAWKQGIVDKLRGGVAGLLKQNGVQVMQGEAFFKASGTAGVRMEKGVSTIDFGNAIIATGAEPQELEGLPVDGQFVIGSSEALMLAEAPENIVVIGAGYIALEMCSVFRKLGSKVCVVNRSDRAMRGLDKDLVDVVVKKLQALGVEFHFNAAFDGIVEQGGKKAVRIKKEGGESIVLPADKVLVTIGHKANTKGLGLENTQVKLDEKGFVKVDERMRTSDHKIYAIGDVVGAPLLAHKASRQGKVAAEAIAGLESAYHNRVVPAVVYCDPEIASAGMGEEEAVAKGVQYVVGRFPFRALGRSMTRNESDGFVKILAEKESGVVLGVHIVGAEAGELISEAALGIEMGAVLEDVAATIHPHPTLPEALMEAAEAAQGKAIHIFQGELKK